MSAWCVPTLSLGIACRLALNRRKFYRKNLAFIHVNTEERTNNYLLVENLDYNSPSDKKKNKWKITLGGKNKKQKGIRCIYCNSSLLALNNADIRKLYRTKVDLPLLLSIISVGLTFFGPLISSTIFPSLPTLTARR